MDELRGTVVAGRYTIDREIGRGGMATVWLAHDSQHDRRVALKTLHPDLAHAIGIDRFLRELRLTARLQHPAIVPILDSGVLEAADRSRVPWYAMPRLEGEPLRARLLREQQLPVDEALRITEAVGKALDAAHRQKIVHRDIKPENIFLAGDEVYVVDFGIAKAIDSTDAERITSTGLAIGTPAYMSPEQSVAGPVDERTDQYSLATVLYEMLIGEPPFSGRNAPLAARDGNRRWIRPAMVAVGLVALVAAAIVAVSSRDDTPSRPVADSQVTALYERGMRAYDRRTPAGVVEAVVAFREVLRRDSTYAPAWNGLAQAYSRAHGRTFNIPGVSSGELLPLAIQAVDRSLALDSLSADAWTTHAILGAGISTAQRCGRTAPYASIPISC